MPISAEIAIFRPKQVYIGRNKTISVEYSVSAEFRFFEMGCFGFRCFGKKSVSVGHYFLPSFLRGNCLLSPFANNFPRAVPIGYRDSAPGLRQNKLSLETLRNQRRRRRLLGTNSPKCLVSTSCSAKGGREEEGGIPLPPPPPKKPS